MGIQILNKDVSVISGVMGKAKASIGNIFGKTGWSGGGGGADVTPNPTPDWGTVGYNDPVQYWNYSQQQIQGINTTITLRTNYDATYSTLWYAVSNTTFGFSNGSPPMDQGFTSISNGGTFTVSNNQWVAFGGEFTFPLPSDATVTVVNQSDGNSTLDTFTLQIDI